MASQTFFEHVPRVVFDRGGKGGKGGSHLREKGDGDFGHGGNGCACFVVGPRCRLPSLCAASLILMPRIDRPALFWRGGVVVF